MNDDFKFKQIFLSQDKYLREWKRLLDKVGINNVKKRDIANLDCSYGIYISNTLVGTVSYEKNILKYIAIDKKYRNEGILFNKLVSKVIEELSYRGFFHVFVLTKPKYKESFCYIGFDELATTKQVSFLEYGYPSIDNFFNEIRIRENKKVSAIVMNANPFTKGHLHLVENAARESDLVYIFILKSEMTLFNTKSRLEMVCNGVRHLKNVEVYLGGDYIISPSTFPLYFFKDLNKVSVAQMELDAQVFLKNFVPTLNISTRFVGEEPYSEMTERYNEILKDTLEPTIKVTEIKRLCTKEGEIISATKVRKYFKKKDMKMLDIMTPCSTYEYLAQLIKGENK